MIALKTSTTTAITYTNCCGAFFLMITTELKSGEIYKVNHSRKGTFKLLVENQCDTWVTGLITDGTAKAILQENEREQFEEITIRKTLCSFVAV